MAVLIQYFQYVSTIDNGLFNRDLSFPLSFFFHQHPRKGHFGGQTRKSSTVLCVTWHFAELFKERYLFYWSTKVWPSIGYLVILNERISHFNYIMQYHGNMLALTKTNLDRDFFGKWYVYCYILLELMKLGKCRRQSNTTKSLRCLMKCSLNPN